MKTLILLNPHAASGAALRRFERVKPSLLALFDEVRVAITQHEREVSDHLRRALHDGFELVLALGGDGSNLVLLNALCQLEAQSQLMFATLPFGTGRDWARTLKLPEDAKMLKWLAQATPQLVDIGRVTLDGQRSWFLNVASVGISGAIAPRLNAKRVKRPWMFLTATVQALFNYNPSPIRVIVDGQLWQEGSFFLVAIGNGRFFGRGMKICPHAMINDGLFDVVLVESMPRLRALTALPSVLTGSHLKRDDVHICQARHVRVEGNSGAVQLEMDGEPYEARVIEFEVQPSAVKMLLNLPIDAMSQSILDRPNEVGYTGQRRA